MMIHRLLITILILHGVHGMKNGHQADENQFPYVVSIQHLLIHLCSGTIIDENHILTAGHPIAFQIASELLVAAGMVRVKYPWFKGFSVENIYFHPGFIPIFPTAEMDDLYWENDIAILKLTESLVWSSTMAPVSLSENVVESYLCFECAIISWNYYEENPNHVVLSWDIAQIVEDDKCLQWDIKVLTNQQCVIDFFETAVIGPEDLGSPIICGDWMIGFLVKEGRRRVAGSPSTFLSTLNYSGFIADIVDDGRMNVHQQEFPYIVSIWYRETYVCGGSLIDANRVLTAAHCIEQIQETSTITDLKIAVGSTEVSQFDETILWSAISDIQIYPLYKHNYDVSGRIISRDHDIAIMTLKKPLQWTLSIDKLRLADSDDFSTEQRCQVLHWEREARETNREVRKLKKSTAILVADPKVNLNLRLWQFSAKNPYDIRTADPADCGNPIVCAGHPFGIMVQANSNNAKSSSTQMIFLQIRPYANSGFLHLN